MLFHSVFEIRAFTYAESGTQPLIGQQVRNIASDWLTDAPEGIMGLRVNCKQ